MATITQNSGQTAATEEIVEAVIISGPQRGRIVSLRNDEVFDAVTPNERAAAEEMLEAYSKANEMADKEEALKWFETRFREIKETYGVS